MVANPLERFVLRLNGRYQRTVSRLLHRKPLKFAISRPIVSFTFDDFPRSALYVGGDILGRFGAKGTYYASFGLMGTTAPTGEIFITEDLPVLLESRTRAWMSHLRSLPLVGNRSSHVRGINGSE